MPSVINEVILTKTENKVILQHPGIQGSSGGHFVHDQGIPSDTWTINHNLGYNPGGITVIDSAGAIVEGHYSYPSVNQIIATFSGSFSGTAYLS